MKPIVRHGLAAAVACALLSSACSAARRSSEPTENLGTSAQELLALSLAVDTLALGPSGGVVLHVTGPSYDTTLTGPGGLRRLPAITNDGTYTIASPAGEAVFGTFIVEAGLVVHSTGALTFASGGLGFDTNKLATVTVPTGTLTTSAVGRYRLGAASGEFGGSPIFRLPDGTFSVTATDGTRPFGTFTIAGRVVTATTGAIVPKLNGIGFDLNALARIVVPAQLLSTPGGLSFARLGAETTPFNGSVTLTLADGAYTLTNGDQDRVFGGFTIAGHTVSGWSGGVIKTATGIGFDATKLASVTIPTGPLTTAAGFQTVRLPKVSTTAFSGTPTFLLPPGTYPVDDGLSSLTVPRRYGELTVAGTGVTSATGALTTTPSGIAFNLSQLAPVKIPLSGLQTPSSPAVIAGRWSNGAPAGGFGAPGPDPTFYLLDGHYTVTRIMPPFLPWGSFDVANRQVIAGTGAFKAGPTGNLQVQTCGLAAVKIAAAPPPQGSLFTIPELMGAAQLLNSTTLLLPPGRYTVRTFIAGATNGSFTVPAQGPLTNVVKPAWLATLSGSMGTCLSPPATTCVGTASAPVDVGFCSVAADATNKLAGGCTDSGSGIASCTFDGMSSRTLSSGDHAVLVAGTSSDGSSSTCTSFVRVAPCGDAPIVTCVGTVAKPAIVYTDDGTCGFGVSTATKGAGTCKPGVAGLASCTFDGASSTTLAPGSYAITVAGTSDNGASASCTSYVSVDDGEAPLLTCAAPVVRECEGPYTSVSTAATCTDNCGLCATECDAGALPIGAGSLVCKGIDGRGREAACASEITIVDTVAPSLSMAVFPTVLTVPNHKLQEVAITASSTDLCDEYPSVRCSASSNEAPLELGSGHTLADIEWVDELTAHPRLFLRAERSGGGSGRVYTIACTAYDASGNTRTSTATVTVPHDMP